MLFKTVMTFLTVASWLSIASADEAPNISGTYNVATLTPLERPVAFGNNLYLSKDCLLYTSPSPRDLSTSRMPSSA